MATPEVENRFENKCEAPAQPSDHVAAEAIADEPRAQTTNTAVLCDFDIIDNGTEATVMDSATGRPAISGDALKHSAIALYDAMHPGFLGSVDYEKVRNILDSYSPDDRKRLEAAYNALKDTDDLRTDLRNQVEPHQFREAEAILERSGETNLIGAVTVALEIASEVDPAKGGEMLIGIVSKLNNDELQDLKLKWAARYGAEYGDDYETAINNSNLSAEDKYLLLGVFAEGQDKRTATDVKLATQELLRRYESEWTNDRANEYLDRMQVLLGGRGVGLDARRELRTDVGFVASYEEAFDPPAIYLESEVATFNRAKDILQEGGVSPATVIAGDMQNSSESWNAIFDGDWVIQNPEHVEKFLTGLDSHYRTDFVEGRRLLGQDYSQLSPAQQEQVDFYKKMDATFKQRGNADQQILWAELMEHGAESPIVKALKTKNEDGYSTANLMAVLDGMSLQDWQLLKSEEGSPTYAQKLQSVVAGFANESDRARFNLTLSQMLEADSFETAKSAESSIAQKVIDVAASGTPADLARVILSMTDEEAAEYANNAEIKKAVDAVVFPTGYDFLFHGKTTEETAAFVLAQNYLRQAEQTGKKPEANTISQAALGIMEGTLTDPSQKMQALIAIMQDQQMRDRMKLAEDESTATLQATSSENYALRDLIKSLDESGNAYGRLVAGEPLARATIEDYGVSLGDSAYTAHLAQPEELQQRVHMDEEQQKILDFVAAQGNKMWLEDDLFSFVRGDRPGALSQVAHEVTYRNIFDRLMNTPSSEREASLQRYKEKYGRDFYQDIAQMMDKTNSPSSEYRAVFDEMIKTNFAENPIINARLAVLDGNENLDWLLDRLSKMDATAKRDFINSYNSTWKSDGHSDILGLVENNYSQSIKLANLMRAEGSDPFQTYIDRLSRFDTTGMDPDGTKEAVRMALEQNAELIRQYQEKRMELPEALRTEMDRYFEQAVMANRDARQNAADDIRMKFQIAAAVVAVISIPLHGGAGLAALGGAAGISTGSAVLQQHALGDGMITDAQTREILLAAGFDVALTIGPAIIPFTKILNARRAAAIDNAIVPATTEGRLISQADSAVGEVAPGVKAQEELDALAAARRADVPAPANDNAVIPQLESEAAREARIRRQIIREQQLEGESVQDLQARLSREFEPAPAGKVEDDKVVLEQADDVEVSTSGNRVEEPELPAAGPKIEETELSTIAANDNDALAVARRRDMADDIDHTRAAATIDESGEEIVIAGQTDNADEIARLRRLEELQERKFARATDSAADDIEDVPVTNTRRVDDADNTAGANSGSTDEFAGKLKDDEIEVIDNATGRRMVGTMDRGLPAVAPEVVSDAVIAERAAAMADRLRRGWQNLRERAVPYVQAIDDARLVTAPAVAAHNVYDFTGDIQEQQPEAQPVVEAAPLPSKQLIELATVKRGEGPWQSAERILAASGQKYGVDEVRALTRAMQAVYKAEHDGNGDMSGLKVNYNFVTNANYDELLAAVKNEEVKAILTGMALAPVS